MTAPSISHAELLEILRYDRQTGKFFWKKKISDKVSIGSEAGCGGCGNNRQYHMVFFYKKRYMAHRLAWFYVTGQWPKAFIDHKDLNCANNAFDNLREATNSQNLWNRRKTAKNTSGLKGVSLGRRGQWQAQITANGNHKWLGYFKTKEAAYAAYCAAADEMHGQYGRAA